MSITFACMHFHVVYIYISMSKFMICGCRQTDVFVNPKFQYLAAKRWSPRVPDKRDNTVFK